MRLATDISLRPRSQAAQELAAYLKAYPSPEDQFSDNGFDALIICAANCLIAHSGEEEFAEKDLMAFINGLRIMQIHSAALALIKKGRIATTVINDELAFLSLQPND